jgi:hypothetical protein
MTDKKGKKNKLKIGDKVQATQNLVSYYVTHLNENFLVPSKTEFKEESYPDIANWLSAHLTKKLPKGKVIGYGATACYPSKKDSNKWEDKKDELNVCVEFKMRYGKYRAYYSENNLKRIK